MCWNKEVWFLTFFTTRWNLFLEFPAVRSPKLCSFVWPRCVVPLLLEAAGSLPLSLQNRVGGVGNSSPHPQESQKSKAGHRWIESRPVQQRTAGIRSIYGQAGWIFFFHAIPTTGYSCQQWSLYSASWEGSSSAEHNGPAGGKISPLTLTVLMGKSSKLISIHP